MTDTSPPSLEDRFEQALASYQVGELQAALTLCQSILTLSPQHTESLHLAGTILCLDEQVVEGLHLLEQVVRLHPHNELAQFNCFIAQQKLGQYPQALASLDQAIALAPDNANYLNHRGILLMILKRVPEAIASYDQALALQPNAPDVWNNKGNALVLDPQRYEEAISCFDQAIAHQPEDMDAYCFNKSTALLVGGRWAEGWPLYESRRTLPGRVHLTQPLWRGEEDIAGKTIFLHHEQGFGDTVQFCRYAIQVKARGAQVMMGVPKGLRQVLSNLKGVDLWVTSGDPLPRMDYHCPMTSLPLALGTLRVEDIPADIPYLFADPVLAALWGHRLGEKKRPRIGLVWNGGLHPERPEYREINGRRNIPFSLFAQLNRPDMDFYSLQKGEPAESELLDIKHEYWPENNLHILGADLEDFVDTAALITHLDLIISVDTAVPHLAAALGKPVWLLNRMDTDWRWMLEREDSPWYPTMKIYRQTRYGEWSDVIERVRTELETLAQTGLPRF